MQKTKAMTRTHPRWNEFCERLNGPEGCNFRNGKTEPITAPGSVSDDRWHHVILSGSLGTQSLFLDGQLVGTVAGEIDHLTMTYNQIGAAQVTGWPGLPDESPGRTGTASAA